MKSYDGAGIFYQPTKSKEYPEYDPRSGEHFWIAIAAFHVADPESEGAQHLDSENLLNVHLGCYFCELAYQPILKRRRCRGEPRV